jgi:hypothetical protein
MFSQLIRTALTQGRRRRGRRRPCLESLEERSLLSYLFTSIDVPDVPDANYTAAAGVNDGGQIVGNYYSGGHYHGFLMDGGSFATVDATPLGASDSVPLGINTTGEIVGQFRDASGHSYGFLKNGGDFTSIDPPGSTSTVAAGINDSGQIVGWYNNSANEERGFLKDGTGYQTIDSTSLGSLGGSTAWRINNSGEIVGGWDDAGVGRGFLKDSTGYHSFDASSLGAVSVTTAYGINNVDQIVGEYVDGSGQSHGYVKDGGVFTAIDYPGATLTRVLGINNSGQLVGQYVDSSGGYHGFLATPDNSTPPPSSLSGLVYSDFNNDAQVDFGEQGIAGVTVTVTGTDDLGHTVNLSQPTDSDGAYVFLNLRPGSYTIDETQPAGYTQGINSVGTGRDGIRRHVYHHRPVGGDRWAELQLR